MKNKHLLLTLLITGITFTSLYAQTYVPALIQSNQTWSPSGNPYIISSTTYIDTNASVKVMPGTIIKSTGHRLMVNGEFQAVGNSSSPIVIDSLEINYNNGSKDYNDSLQSGAFLKHCFIQGLGSGKYTIKTNSTSIRLDYCTFRNTYYCLNVSGNSTPSHSIVSNCDMAGDAYGNGYPIYASGGIISLDIHNNYIHDAYTLYLNGTINFHENQTNRLKAIQVYVNQNTEFGCNVFKNMINGMELMINSYNNPVDISLLNNTFDTVGGTQNGTTLYYPMLKMTRYSADYKIRNFVAKGNNFLHCTNSTQKIVINGTNSPKNPDTLNFKENFWGGTTSIDTYIKDAKDDVSLFAYVDWSNYLQHRDTSCFTVPTSCPDNIDFYFSSNAKTVSFINASTGGNNYKIHWDFGDGETDTNSMSFLTHTYREAGSYEVCMKVYTAYNVYCGSKCDTIDISTDTGCLAQFYLAVDTTRPFNLYIVNSSSGITSNTQFTWTFGDGGSSNLKNPSHTYNSFGLFNLCLTIFDSANNCNSTYCDSIGLDSMGKLLKKGGFTIQVIDESELSTGKTDEPGTIQLYPNPTRDLVTVKFDASMNSPVSLSVYNHVGQQVLEKSNLKPEQSEISLDLSELEAGIYYIRMNYDNKNHSVKLIKN